MGNGTIPAAALGDVPGPNAGLLKQAALAYTAMHFESVRRFGIPLTLVDGSIGRCYRSFARQVIARNFWCAQGKCGNAAIAGTSNHGEGTTVDLMTAAQRWAVDQIGAFYGWAKRCSDASWEWWHVKYDPACTGARWTPRPPRPDPLRKLGKRQRAAAERLLYHRTERRREAKGGIGPRWHKQDRWVNFWYGRVERLWRRADGDRKRVLRRVLDDRNGQI